MLANTNNKTPATADTLEGKFPSSVAELRPDVLQVIGEFVRAMSAGTYDRNPWRGYSAFKHRLSAVCGWDARGGGYDQAQYDRGIRQFCREVGL